MCARADWLDCQAGMNPKGTFASVVIVMSIEGMKVVDPLSGEVLSTTPIKGISYEYYSLLY